MGDPDQRAAAARAQAMHRLAGHQQDPGPRIIRVGNGIAVKRLVAACQHLPFGPVVRPQRRDLDHAQRSRFT
jgi:hypothetical protein